MHIISLKRLRDFWIAYPDAELPLRRWHKLLESADYSGFSAIRRDFPQADWVDGLIVFNIGGNKYRLIAVVRFHWRKLFVVAVLTHAEYDRGEWKP